MSPDQAKASCRRELAKHGMVEVRRGATSATVRARVTGFSPDDVTGSVTQGQRKVCVMRDDLAAAGFPLPIVKNDTIVWNGKTLRVTAVDDATAAVGGVLIAYWLWVAGA